MNKIVRRNPAMDFIRCFAFFSVVSVHFFLNNGFYSQELIGKRMYLMTCMRHFFMVCVPLFLVLTGYLMRKKKLSKEYYWKGAKTVSVYILACLVWYLFYTIVQEKTISLVQLCANILRFNAGRYAWYIEMYLGLFIFIPFLNILYNNIQEKKWKQILIITLLCLTSIPPVVNVYDFSQVSWWVNPASSDAYHKILPYWWGDIYPLTYYFIGCYLNEYGFKIHTKVNVVLIIVSTILFGTYNYWRGYGEHFIKGPWTSWGSLFNVIQTVLVFTFFMNLDYSKLSHKKLNFMKCISDLCLGGYLVSGIFDVLLYAKLNNKVTEMPYRLEYYVIIVPIVILGSLVVSWIMELTYKGVVKIISHVKETIQKTF